MHFKKIFIFVFLFCLSFIYLCQAEEKNFCAQVTEEGINVRVDSTVSSKIITTLKKGDFVNVVEEKYGWFKIKLPPDSEAYIRKDMVGIIDDLNKPLPEELIAEEKNINLQEEKSKISALDASLKDSGKTLAKVLKSRVNVRLGPSEESLVIGSVDKSEIVVILDSENNWYRIVSPANSYGWINNKFLTIAAAVKNKELAADESAREHVLSENNFFEGTIKPYGRIFGRLGSHKLITGEGKIFILKADKKMLDGLINKKVKVYGKFLAGTLNRKYPVILVGKVEIED